MIKKASVLTLSLLALSACYYQPKIPMDLVVTATLDRTDAKVNYDVPLDICIRLDFTDEGNTRQHQQCVEAVPFDAQKNFYQASFNSTLVFERSGFSKTTVENADFKSVTVTLVSHLGKIPLKTKAKPEFTLTQEAILQGSIKYECKMDAIASDTVAELEQALAQQVETNSQVRDQMIGSHIEARIKGLDLESLNLLCGAFSKRQAHDSQGSSYAVGNPVKQHVMVTYTEANFETLTAPDLVRLDEIAHFPPMIQAIHQRVQALHQAARSKR